ncbi:growth arrest and DNA damage-inducible proteins-interacting protein 1 [Condylostylus longicornis]|uniref:growth arrest and DNA damage-inducible proteins-interacting protein 1 n=1 Tax=Condylostylus longicornis TaxID=2530218 RepID=UPI00244E34BA|nr:growth arrest and DNA damage-inducible proteins-interacting protein 1 [Condylostylus longicornis]
MFINKVCSKNPSRIISVNSHLKVRVLSNKSILYSKEKVENEEEPVSAPSFMEVEEDKPQVNLNKSRLLPQHLNILNNQRPYDEPHSWIHLTEKYQRKLYGRYGNASRVNPRICFPTKEDEQMEKDYERIAYPFSLEEMIEKNKKEKADRVAKILQREEDIEKKLKKLGQWTADLNAKIAKKEADALAAKERKERLVEEVRRHFGFKIDPRDDRFKEMLEQKEKEDKKKQKEAKRKAKEDKMMTKLISMTEKKESS